MKFSYIPTVAAGLPHIPTLVIPVSELLKGKDFTKEESFREVTSFRFCIQVYTAYCGARRTMLSSAYQKFCESLGRKGTLLISCIEEGSDPKFLARLQNDEGEFVVDLPLVPQVQGHVIPYDGF